MLFLLKETTECNPFFLYLARAFPIILISASKSTNSLGYRELREPIRARENGYRLIW